MTERKTLNRAIGCTVAALIIGLGASAVRTDQACAAPGEEIRIGSVIEHPFGAGTVKGAPFAAQLIFESTQTFANGLRTSQSMTGALYRDTEGRTRHELPRSGAPEIVSISDPVAGVLYSLHMFQHAARRLQVTPMQQNREMEEHEMKARALQERQMVTSAGPVADVSAGDKAEPLKKVDALGTLTLERVQAVGTRVTITVPEGTEGNDRAFDIISEKWYSPELQMVVMVKMSDPRRGDTTYRLTNIDRSEQPRALFEVPPDFSVSDGKTEGEAVKLRVN